MLRWHEWSPFACCWLWPQRRIGASTTLTSSLRFSTASSLRRSSSSKLWGFAVKGAEDKVLKLCKVLYGLQQAPRVWNAKLNATLGELGFTRCATEHALYMRARGRRSSSSACMWMT